MAPIFSNVNVNNTFLNLGIKLMSRIWTCPKMRTFSHIFQECARQRALDTGKQTHARMIISGFKPTVFVTNCLMHMYIKCSRLVYAHKVFDKMPQRDTVSWNSIIFAYAERCKMETVQFLFDLMPERDVVSWNTLLSSYLQMGNHRRCIDIFFQIVKGGVLFDNTTLAMVLKCSSSFEDYTFGTQVHGLVVKMGFDGDMVSGSALIDMYAKCRYLDDSWRFFYEMPEKNWVCWSAIIAGFVQSGRVFDGFNLFKEMQRQGVGVCQSTYASLFKSCAGISALNLGSQLHAHALKNDFGTDVIVATATLDMYAKCQRLEDSVKVFDTLPCRGVQSYNAMIVGYVQSGRGSEALELFQLLRKSGLCFNEVSLSVSFTACALIQDLSKGCQLHGLAIKCNFQSNICVTNAILDMYGKCGSIDGAQCVFDEMLTRDVVSWNAVIAAYEKNGLNEKTLHFFASMLSYGVEPDEFTYGSVLKASACKLPSNCGMEIHGRVIKSGMGFHSFVGSTLVDMYSKYGMIDEAMKLHYRLGEQNVVSWNAIITGYLLQNQNEEAQFFFSLMLEIGVEPDNFTYATILDTCANLANVGLGNQA